MTTQDSKNNLHVDSQHTDHSKMDHSKTCHGNASMGMAGHYHHDISHSENEGVCFPL